MKRLKFLVLLLTLSLSQGYLVKRVKEANIGRDNLKYSVGYVEDDGKIVGIPDPPDCGVRPSEFSRIVKGKNASLGDFPWMAALGYYNEINKQIEWQCAGTLITRKHVLTSAHCIRNNLAVIRLGDLNLYRDDDNAQYIDAKFSDIIEHEDFVALSLLNDIAIIKLAKMVTNKEIIPICLPFEETKTFEGYELFVAGWGRKGPNLDLSEVLQYTKIKAIALRPCRKKTPDIRVFTQDHICGWGNDTDSCEGDSGAPLMWMNTDKYDYSVYYIVGIVSWGVSCAKNPAAYTRVTSYLEWIDNNT